MPRRRRSKKPVSTSRHGGRRPGAGRKKTGLAISLPHRTRPRHQSKHPVHIIGRVVPGIPSLRTPAVAGAIVETIGTTNRHQARLRSSFRVVAFAIHPELLHIVVEAGSNLSLTRGLRGLGVWIARRVNAVIGRSGKLLYDRYHERALVTPREVRDTLVFLMKGHHRETPRVDEWSSGPWFDGWHEPVPAPAVPAPVAAARTALLRTGWRRLGLVRLDESPGADPAPDLPRAR